MKRLSEDQVQIELKLAREAFNDGDAVSANQQIDRVLHSNPDSAEAHFGKGMILAVQERLSEALPSFVQALRYQPGNAEALRWATVICLRLGKPDQAEAFARRLTRIQPNDDRAYLQLSNALTLLGRFDEALEAIERSLAIRPLNLDYVVGKAQLLGKLHWWSLAIEWFRKAIEMRPVPELAIELANVLMNESQVQEALSLLERHAPQLPPESRPHALMGRAYTESYQFDKAEEHWISAGKISPDRIDLVPIRARSEIMAGRIQVAEQLLRESLENDPSAAPCYQLLATIKKMTCLDVPLIENMERLLSDSELEPGVRQDLNYALGKSYHDLGDYSKAIARYDEANRLDREINSLARKFDPVKWRAYTDFQIQFFTKERVRSLAKEGLESCKPLFIMGMIRSGTTLSEQILSCHSKIQDGGEKSFWADRVSKVLDLRAGRFDMAAAKRLGREYLRILASDESRTKFVIDKYPSNVLLGAPLHCVYPNAKLVHVKRHAVDNLLSIWMTPMKTGLPFVSDRENLVFAYREYVRLVRHLEDVLPGNRFKTFQYEEITSNPQPTIQSMLSFLDLEVEPNCFSPEKNPRTVRTPSAFQVRQPINKDSQAKWRLYQPWLGPFTELLN